MSEPLEGRVLSPQDWQPFTALPGRERLCVVCLLRPGQPDRSRSVGTLAGVEVCARHADPELLVPLRHALQELHSAGAWL